MRFVRTLFPWLLPSFHILLSYTRDAKRFIKFTTNNNYKASKLKHEAIIRRMGHGLEKAFSLPDMKPVFGMSNASGFIYELRYYYKKYGFDELLKDSLDIILIYKNYISKSKADGVSELISKINSLTSDVIEYNATDVSGCVLEFKKENVISMMKQFDFTSFCQSRYSVRDLSNEPVDLFLIKDAINTSLKTPSACNRQPWKVHIFQGEKAKFILKYQNGNRGFNKNIQTVLLITGELTSFSNGERNQVYIDGGLFSMSLIYALHGKALGVCALNTALKVPQEKMLFSAASLPSHEVPIMMLAVGNLKETYKVARSKGKLLSDIVCEH